MVLTDCKSGVGLEITFPAGASMYMKMLLSRPGAEARGYNAKTGNLLFAPVPPFLVYLGGAGRDFTDRQIGCYNDIAVMLYREVGEFTVFLGKHPESTAAVGRSDKAFYI